jgi:hypothetical protein
MYRHAREFLLYFCLDSEEDEAVDFDLFDMEKAGIPAEYA